MKDEPEYDLNIIKTRVRPKPKVRLLASHNLPRAFMNERRQIVVNVTEQTHAIIKQIADVWGVGVPSYVTYAMLTAIERDAGVHLKWLEHSTTSEVAPAPEPLPPSQFPPSTPAASNTTSTSGLDFDPVAALWTK